jgi:hypothetical protein
MASVGANGQGHGDLDIGDRATIVVPAIIIRLMTRSVWERPNSLCGHTSDTNSTQPGKIRDLAPSKGVSAWGSLRQQRLDQRRYVER